MKKIYICSRYAGDVPGNRAKAQAFSQYAFKHGYMPTCVHIFLNEITGLLEEKDRVQLLDLAKSWVFDCDQVWVFDIDGISSGMQGEIDFALNLQIPIRKFKVYEGNIIKEVGEITKKLPEETK